MAKSKRSEKEAVIAELAEKLNRAQALVLADYRGLNVAQMTQLRNEAREAEVELRVIKNTLAARAAAEAGMEGLATHLTGPTAVAFGYDEPTAPAKLLAEFSGEARQLRLKGGFSGGRVLSAGDVRELATLPSREVLLGRVLGGISAPLSNLASVLAAPLRELATLTDALHKKREAEEAAD